MSESEVNNQGADPQQQPAESSHSRRAFLNKAAITVPIVASLSSRSVWAMGNNCSLTGALSGNQSAHGQDWCTGFMTMDVAGWLATDPWPTGLSRMTLFRDIFTIDPRVMGKSGAPANLNDVLMDTSAPPLDALIVSAYLNQLAGNYQHLGMDVITEQVVIDSYIAARSGGPMKEQELVNTLLFIQFN